MAKSQAEMEEKIGTLGADFLKMQFGENVASGKTFLLGSVVTVCATNGLAPFVVACGQSPVVARSWGNDLRPCAEGNDVLSDFGNSGHDMSFLL